MNIKKITKKLSNIRDHLADNGMLSREDKEELRTMVQETLDNAPEKLSQLPKNISPYLPIADNDNTPLTPDQKLRLRLMEKTGTGSCSIH